MNLSKASRVLFATTTASSQKYETSHSVRPKLILHQTSTTVIPNTPLTHSTFSSTRSFSSTNSSNYASRKKVEEEPSTSQQQESTQTNENTDQQQTNSESTQQSQSTQQSESKKDWGHTDTSKYEKQEYDSAIEGMWGSVVAQNVAKQKLLRHKAKLNPTWAVRRVAIQATWRGWAGYLLVGCFITKLFSYCMAPHPFPIIRRDDRC